MDLGFRLQHFGMEISDMNQPHTIHYWDLVGGFNPSEKNMKVNGVGIIPHIMEK
jgi:hypothetical protein